MTTLRAVGTFWLGPYLFTDQQLLEAKEISIGIYLYAEDDHATVEIVPSADHRFEWVSD